ncbi:MAG: hypothetical protein ISS16_07395 [Ignavibacteria bacterium]|nr:hypothetical protein [Ignavibacteria bacterium]
MNLRNLNLRIYLIALSVIFSTITFLFIQYALGQKEDKLITDGVCPPFHLLDESGEIINPLIELNIDKPYSPRQTCGRCHDYNKITEGYHFTQGAGENPTELQTERYQWVSTPGNYGGSWCSPAPLYRYLSPKKNNSSRTIDMTSFSFITDGCGTCHPGGGSAEYDRNGKRYDKLMKEKGYTSGGNNNFDGDYYQARWIETGVLEADCMICHFPEYNFSERKKQLNDLNFRWAPTAAAGFGSITGSIRDSTLITINYNKSLFDADGKVSPHIVREPRDNACLNCHAKPGWKKRGANFRNRTDVHIRAGLKCVDCHPAGSKAMDDRINKKEMHQIGKGDDPGGQVRNDLDNTVLDCDYCHTNGHLGAPITKHVWLPPLHLDKIACQTCHIPERTVKSAQFQASDVFNPGTKIPTKGKHLWTFYGPDMEYWNHYGDLEMMGYDDKPTDPFKPVLTLYKGKIYPVNRIHSTWPAIEIEGKSGLMQPKMGDIYKMWTTHFNNPNKYPELSKIKDDNGDGVIEVNRAEEIDALILSVTSMLVETNYPMEGKRVVWVMNDKVYTSGTEFYTIPKEEWETSPYANVHKYNHDVYPAKTALGSNGCDDCHSNNSDFFFAKVVQYPFDNDGKPITQPQYLVTSLNSFFVILGNFRETNIKPLTHYLSIIFICILVGLGYRLLLRHSNSNLPNMFKWKFLPLIISTILIIITVFITLKPDLREMIFPTRFWFESIHFSLSMFIIMLSFILYAVVLREKNVLLKNLLIVFIIISLFSGFLLLIKIPFLEIITKLCYTLFDISLLILLVMIVLILSINFLINVGTSGKILK